jgi:hypothetical protein
MDLYKRVLTLIVVVLVGVAIVLLYRHTTIQQNQQINQSLCTSGVQSDCSK